MGDLIPWATAIVGALSGFLLAARRYAAAPAPELPASVLLANGPEDQPPEKHDNPSRYFYACAQRLNVSTQTLKDLGFTVTRDDDGTCRLNVPEVPKDLEALARSAMLEIAAEARQGRIPVTSWRWIANVAARWNTRP